MGMGMGGQRSGRRPSTVWYLDANGKLSISFIRPGVTDNSFTEILRSELKEGQEIITGLATAQTALWFGAIQGALWANVGNTISGTMSDLLRYQADAPRRKLIEQQTKMAEAGVLKRQREDAFGDSLKLLLNDPTVFTETPDGAKVYDRKKLQQSVMAAGYADRWDDISALEQFAREATNNKAKSNLLFFLCLYILF